MGTARDIPQQIFMRGNQMTTKPILVLTIFSALISTAFADQPKPARALKFTCALRPSTNFNATNYFTRFNFELKGKDMKITDAYISDESRRSFEEQVASATKPHTDYVKRIEELLKANDGTGFDIALKGNPFVRTSNTHPNTSRYTVQGSLAKASVSLEFLPGDAQDFNAMVPFALVTEKKARADIELQTRLDQGLARDFYDCNRQN